MIERRRRQADLLEGYWEEVARNAVAVPPEELDAELAETVRRMESRLRPPEPEDAFAGELGQRLAAHAERMTFRQTARKAAQARRPLFPMALFVRRWSLAGIAAAAVAVLAVATFFVASRPESVSAEEIVRRAQEAIDSPIAAGIKSFVSVERTASRPGNPRMNAYAGYTGDEEIRSETKRWYEAPNRWRMEGSGTTVDAHGNELPDLGWSWISVSDGKDVRRYDARTGIVTVRALGVSTSGKTDSYGGESTLGQGTVDPLKALQVSNPNVRPMLQGDETVAGRKAYVLAFPPETRSASAPEMNGPRTVWVDKESYFVLKIIQYGGTDGTLLSTMEVTGIEYNTAIDPALFRFTPPAGAKVDDQRPKPAPTKGQFQQQMGELAKQVDFPVFLPNQVPNGLVPRQPRMDGSLGLHLEYLPPAEADKDGFPTMRVIEQRATYDLVSRWTWGAESTTIGTAKGWLRRGFRNVDGTGGDSAALVLRDGTLVSVSSFTLSPEDLVQVAASLEPVPGGHAPLPNPTAPSLEEIRRQASFKLFLPEYIPAGLKPEPPVPGQQQGSDRVDALNVTYHSADGAVALQLVEGPPRDPSGMAKPMLTAPEVAIKGAITGRLYDAPNVQVRLLWWMQDGTYLSLETRVLPKEELLRVAASMSPTAELGQVEPPAPRPTPTPVPAPKFTVLRPTWLPEPMTAREQYLPDPTGRGTELVIGFDPRPEDKKPHGVLILKEMSKGAMPTGLKPDPEETLENIEGREVRVISRGENWITLTWVQGDVALILENPYDPPGHPRYTPDELRRVVESIR